MLIYAFKVTFFWKTFRAQLTAPESQEFKFGYFFKNLETAQLSKILIFSLFRTVFEITF